MLVCDNCLNILKTEISCYFPDSYKINLFQVTSPLAYMFIAVHHNVSAEQIQQGVPEITRYTYGYKDLCAIFFYFLISIVMHAIIQEYVLDVSTRLLYYKVH